jgi:hypothetical protein
VRSQSGDDGSFRTTRLEGLIDALIEVERPVNGIRTIRHLLGDAEDFGLERDDKDCSTSPAWWPACAPFGGIIGVVHTYYSLCLW